VNSKLNKNGFTLLEILVAMAMVVTIVSIVYGTYSATSKSTQTYKSKMAVSQELRNVLEQMARQIRCLYTGSTITLSDSSDLISKQKKLPENKITYFRGDPYDKRGEILHLVTTSGFLRKQKPANGLFIADYRLDRNTGSLFLKQRRFTGKAGVAELEDDWQVILENAKRVELAFFNGEKWLQKWDFTDNKKVPYAVKVNIICEDENYRQYLYETVAYICSRICEGGETGAGTSASVKKQ